MTNRSHQLERVSTTLLAIALCAIPRAASAHHAAGGTTPTSLWEGLLSGLAHPVIGVDHLIFVIGVGLWSALGGLRWQAPAAFVAGTWAGCVLHLLAIDVPLSETWVLGSLIVGGIGLLFVQRPRTGLLLGLLSTAGMLHGYAYGESIVGARAEALGAYLTGFAIVQLCLSEGARQIYLRTREIRPTRALQLNRAWGLGSCAFAFALLAIGLVG